MLMINRKKHDVGFTLIELMVVIMIISLLAGIAVPSAIKLFSSSADTQAYNLFNAQLSYARAVAIENQTYAGLHSQMADNDSPAVERIGLKDKCVTAVVKLDTTTTNPMYFEILKGTTPKPLPAKMAFGNVSSHYLSGSNYSSSIDIADFTNLTIVFNSNGEIVTNIPNYSGSLLFQGGSSPISGNNRIWSDASADNVINFSTAVTLINYKEAAKIADDGGELKEYLDENAQFLPVNIYTGRMLPRE